VSCESDDGQAVVPNSLEGVAKMFLDYVVAVVLAVVLAVVVVVVLLLCFQLLLMSFHPAK